MRMCQLTHVPEECAVCPIRLLYPGGKHGENPCPDFESRDKAKERLTDIREYLANAVCMANLMLGMLQGKNSERSATDSPPTSEVG